MGHCISVSKSKKKQKLIVEDQKKPSFQAIQKENLKEESKQTKPINIHEVEDEKEEENEKDFGEYEGNAILPKKIIERKNSIKYKVVDINSFLAESETIFSQRATKNPMTRHLKIVKPLEEIVKIYNIVQYDSQRAKKLKVLGKGSFGKVFLAYNESLGFMAIKEIKFQEKDDLRRLLYEVEILKTIERTKNQNFLKFHGVFKKDEMEYVIEMASGEINLLSMFELRKNRNKPYTQSELVYILSFLCKQYDFLEQNKIAHSDVKPQNVIVAKSSESPSEFIYCIADFGTSFLLEKEEKQIPCADLFGFSPKYASPEMKMIESGNNQFETYDPYLADVYSLGVAILELMGIKKQAFLESHQDQGKVFFSKIQNL